MKSRLLSSVYACLQPTLVYLDSILFERPKPPKQIALPPPDPVWILGLQEEWKKNKSFLFFYSEARMRPLTRAYTVEKQTLWRHNDSGSCIAIRGRFHSDEIPGVGCQKIAGNLYRIGTDAWNDLDQRMGNGVYFERRQVELVIPLLDYFGLPFRIKAWQYVGTEMVRAQIIHDRQLFRRAGRHFALMPTDEDYHRRWIGKHYLNKPITIKEPTCFFNVLKGLNDPSPPAPRPTPPVAININGGAVTVAK